MRPTQQQLEKFVDAVVATLEGDLDATIPTSDPPPDARSDGLDVVVEKLNGQIASLKQLSRERSRLVDELQRTKLALETTEKVALIGRLAASVGHGVNNPAAILTLDIGEMLADLETEQRTRPDDPFLGRMKRSLLECEEAVGRIAAVANGLQGFDRPGRSVTEPLDLVDLTKTALQLTRNDLRHRAVVQESFDHVPKVLAARGGLVRVIVNLLLNGADAMRGMPLTDSRLTILCSPDDDGVVLAVEDSGPGVPGDQIERIFDPFYSTKEQGGLGLGLAISREVAERNNGTLKVEGAPGGGARFVLRLPRAGSEVREEPRDSAATEGLRVLVIDDEEPLRGVIDRILGRAGHRAVLADSGKAALRILARDAEFDVVVCDLMMPGISGVAVLEYIEENHPHLLPRTMLLTGGALTDQTADAIERHSSRVVHKPIGPVQLMSAINKIVDQAPL